MQPLRELYRGSPQDPPKVSSLGGICGDWGGSGGESSPCKWHVNRTQIGFRGRAAPQPRLSVYTRTLREGKMGGEGVAVGGAGCAEPRARVRRIRPGLPGGLGRSPQPHYIAG